MKTEKINLAAEGSLLAAALDLPEKEGKLKFVVACHGLFSAKDSEKWQALGQRLTQKGYGLLRIDFRGCGESEGRIEECTISGRLIDLEVAIDYVKNHPAFTPPLGLVGSSLGGILVMLEADKIANVGATVALATPTKITVSPEVEASLKQRGYYQYQDPEIRLNKDFWEDAEKYSLIGTVSDVSCPTLVIHGDADEQVPVENGKKLYEGLNCVKKLEIIHGGDHRISDPGHRERLINKIAGWFVKHMPA